VTYTPITVVTQQFGLEDFQFTMQITGTCTTDNVGSAVKFDNTGLKSAITLVGVGDHIVGRLESFEARLQEGINVGNVSRKFRSILPTDGTVINVGDEVVGGATAGTVKSNPTQPAENAKTNRALEVLTGNRVVVEKL
jgi:hypothetical protein